MTQTYHRDRFTWLVYLFFTFYAYYLNLLGPITPFLKDELKLSYTVSSLHFTAFALGILLIGLSGHWLIQRLGRWRSLWIGAFGMSLSALLLIIGQSPFITIGAAFCMGLIGSLILVIAPAALSDWHREQRAVALSESNMIASLVSTAAPLIVGWTAHLPGGWRLALGIAALIPILMRLGFGNAAPPESTSNQTASLSSGQPLPRLYWIYWAALVLAIAVEFCMIFWSADYLATGLGLLKVNAAQAVSLFLAGMIVGRLVGSRIVHSFSTHLVIFISLGIAGAGFLLFWMTSQVIPALIGLFITGLGVANLYPLILSLAIGAAGNNTIQAGVRATLATGTAVLTLPLVLGQLADLIGIRPAYGVVALLLIGVFLIILVTSRKASITAILLVVTLTACSPLGTPTSTPIPPTPTSVTGLQAINGTSLYYESLGQGAPLFVLHGGPGGSHRYFLPYLADLTADHHLFFYDQRGTGLSDGHLELEAISIDQFVEDLEALRVAFGLEKISLMGHSWGGIIALAYALKYQAHLDHLILVDSVSVSKTFSIAFGQTIQQRVQSLSADAQQELNTTCTRPSAKLAPEERDECNQLDAQLRFYDPAKAAKVDWPMEENTLKNSETVRALILNSFNRVQPEMEAQLPTVHVPTLIVHGDFDPIPVASAEYLHQQIPGSQLVVISQSGHFPFIEQPEQFITALRAFLAS